MKRSVYIMGFLGVWLSIAPGLKLSQAMAQGVVNVQNGNITHTYQDFSVPGHGYNLALERSFNSKSTYDGLFGHKWGSNFDTLFEVTPEATVEITEFGGGFLTTFSNKDYSRKDMEAFVEKVYAKIPPGSQSQTLKESLLKDHELRHQLALENKVINEIPMGAKLSSNDRGPETLEKTKGSDGKVQWIRSFADGKKEFFNDLGLMVRREDPNKNFLRLEYDKDGRLAKVSDRVGRQMIFHFTPKGKVEWVRSPLGQKCEYQYDNEGNLKSAKNAAGFEFNYKYNTNHHMTELVYSTGQKEIMEYDDEDQIILHQGPDDIKTTYVYDKKGSPGKYFNVVVTKEIGKNLVSAVPLGSPKAAAPSPNVVTVVDKYEYEFDLRDNGSSYTKKITTVIDKVRTETMYTPCCGKPLSINRDGEITRFEYTPSGLLKSKTSPNGDMITLHYENPFSKVSKVDHFYGATKKSDFTEYKYDQKGNLAFATNKEKKLSVQLQYDVQGRIKLLTDQVGKKIAFDYNELGKPTKITQEGVGSIIVSYNANGDITNVKSTAGRQIAVEVTSAFQSLLDVIRPAGVSLNI